MKIILSVFDFHIGKILDVLDDLLPPYLTCDKSIISKYNDFIQKMILRLLKELSLKGKFPYK